MVTNLEKILLATLVFFIFSCVDEAPRIVPDVYVQFSINMELPQYTSLKNAGNALIVPNQGYNRHGVIIYNSFDDFLAFDATCPQHIENPTAVVLDDEGAAGTATCPECKVVYSFFENGLPSKGYPLKTYVVTKSGSFLYVANQ
ncbi:MAG TPA: hypothetical protein VFC87_02220 [Perlabentimonas sp.]|nr:hypothetical protein [Perlabentimonas sp.]